MSLSEIRVNTTKTRTGVGTITYTETGPVITGIATASNFKTGSTNVHSTGVELANINTGGSTATFGGPISGTTASFSGTVSIGGTLTYEDVTNIDSVGILTARAGVRVPDGGRDSNEAHIRIGDDGDFRMYHEAGAHTTLENHSSSSDLILMTSSAARDIIFKTNGNNERLHISTDGRIGINTSNPRAQFEVLHDSGGIIRLSKGGYGGDTNIGAGDTLGRIEFRSYDGSTNHTPYSGTYAQIETIAVDNLAGTPGENVRLDLKIADSDEPGSGKTLTPVPALSILQGGQVGINTTTLVSGNNYATLHVGGDASSSGGSNVLIGNLYNSGLKHPKNCQLILAGQHNSTGYNGDGQVKLYITGSDNDGGAVNYPVFCEDENANVQMVLRQNGNDVEMGLGTATPDTPNGSNADNPLNGVPLFTMYGDSPAINLVSSTTTSSDWSSINFGRTGSSTNPYRAVIGYHQSADLLRINAKNSITFDTGGDINTGEAARIDSSGRILSYGTLGAGNLPLSGNAANAALHIRSNNKYKGIAFGEGAVSGTIGMGGDDSSTALVYTANAHPANLGGGEHATHEWWSGNSGGGGPAKFMVLTTGGNLGISTAGPDAKLDVGGSAPEIRLTNTATSRSYLSWWNHYSGNHNKNANISYNEGNANWEFKIYRADSQANSPYGNIQFFTGSTSSPTLALNITRPGSVTMPKQPCCVMTATSATTWSSGWTKIPLNSSYFDVGNNFDSGNNRYSIPVSGKYAIGFNVEMNIGSGQTWIYFVPRINRNDTTSKNAGINYADFAPMSNNSTNHYYCHSGHWIANLTQGDTVTWEMHGAGNSWTVANNNQSHYYIYQVA